MNIKPLIHYLPVILLIAAVMYFSIRAKKLTTAGAITGGVIAILIFAGAGYTGIAMLGAFFIFGTVATSWKKQEKQHLKSPGDHFASSCRIIQADDGSKLGLGNGGYFVIRIRDGLWAEVL